MAIERHHFASSNLLSGSYDSDTQELEITFQSGEAYSYQNVPQGIWAGLIAAGSPGGYFHRQVKSRFGGTRV